MKRLLTAFLVVFFACIAGLSFAGFFGGGGGGGSTPGAMITKKYTVTGTSIKAATAAAGSNAGETKSYVLDTFTTGDIVEEGIINVTVVDSGGAADGYVQLTADAAGNSAFSQATDNQSLGWTARGDNTASTWLTPRLMGGVHQTTPGASGDYDNNIYLFVDAGTAKVINNLSNGMTIDIYITYTTPTT